MHCLKTGMQVSQTASAISTENAILTPTSCHHRTQQSNWTTLKCDLLGHAVRLIHACLISWASDMSRKQKSIFDAKKQWWPRGWLEKKIKLLEVLLRKALFPEWPKILYANLNLARQEGFQNLELEWKSFQAFQGSLIRTKAEDRLGLAFKLRFIPQILHSDSLPTWSIFVSGSAYLLTTMNVHLFHSLCLRATV